MMKRTQPRLPWRVVRLDVAAQLKIPALPRLPFIPIRIKFFPLQASLVNTFLSHVLYQSVLISDRLRMRPAVFD
jgi:hypothetical protein